jgi:hypothetical protein
MILKPVIASYSGESYSRIINTLTQDYLDVVAEITNSPADKSDINEEMLHELTEMHVLVEENNSVKLNTAVFLEEDIKRITTVASALGRDLAKKLIDVGTELMNASPEIRNFLGGIIGVGQGTSKFLREKSIVVDWKNYTGKYAQSKVDFDEICDAYNSLGQDLQNKSVFRGERYTAVFIGPGGRNYLRLVNQIYSAKELNTYRNELMKYLTDSYAMLVGGMLNSDSLKHTAEEVNLFKDGKPNTVLINNEVFQLYAPVIKKISDMSTQFYSDNLNLILECLRNTAAGRQGVPPENMMLNFWRYCRKVLAKELYESHFFTDQVPVLGSITVFYDNTIDELNELLG